MALISTIRKHSGLAVMITAIGLILFLIGGDMVRLSTVLSGKQKTEVGEIAGQKISLWAYQAQVEQLRRVFSKHMGIQEALIRDQAWRQLTTQLIYQKECAALGLVISEDELVDMVQGDHVHPELQLAFRDAKTKEFDKQQLIAYLQKLTQMPQAQQVQWHQFERELAALRQREKITQLMSKSTFVTELEAKAQHDIEQSRLQIKCLYIPYYRCAEDAVQVTETMLKDYLMTHKSTYQVKESRSIQYVVFPIEPTKEDERAFQEAWQVLKKSFAQAKDDRTFAKMNTEGKASLTYLKLTPQQLPNTLAAQKHKLEKGMVIGPVQEGPVYKCYKIAAINTQAVESYEVAVIEKSLNPSERARDQVFRKADHCASTVQNVKQLETYAAQEALQCYNAQVSSNDEQVGQLAQARELVRWLYNDASIGQISPVFELGNTYIVGIMTQHVPAGTVPLAQVRDEITLKVCNQHKARVIMTKLQQLNGTTLEEKITQYGDGAKLLEIEQLRFEDDTLQNAGMARQAVGTAFALMPGVQATVADEHGVLVVELVARNNAPALEDVSSYQQNLMHSAKIKQPYEVLQALETLMPIKDNRHKFY